MHICGTRGDELILVMLKLEYSVRITSVQWLLMPWLFVSLDRQVISCHGIDCARKRDSFLPWEKISNTCTILLLRNDNKCKYIFLQVLKQFRTTRVTIRLCCLSSGSSPGEVVAVPPSNAPLPSSCLTLGPTVWLHWFIPATYSCHWKCLAGHAWDQPLYLPCEYSDTDWVWARPMRGGVTK